MSLRSSTLAVVLVQLRSLLLGSFDHLHGILRMLAIDVANGDAIREFQCRGSHTAPTVSRANATENGTIILGLFIGRRRGTGKDVRNRHADGGGTGRLLEEFATCCLVL